MPRASTTWPFAAALLLALLLPAVAAAEDGLRWKWVPPRVQGESGASLLLKAYYSKDNDLGAGLELIRPFRFPGSGRLEEDAELRLKTRFTQNGHLRGEARAEVFFAGGLWHLKSSVRYDDLFRRFWGIGSDTSSSAEETYRPQNTLAYVELFRTVFPRLRLGARLEFQHFKYAEVEEGRLLAPMTLPGQGLDNILGGGLVFEIDTRDDRYEPRRGAYVQGFALFFEEGLGSELSFNNYHWDVRKYLPVANRQTLALQLFGWSARGSAPIWRYGELGGRSHSRGYRHARYIAPVMFAGQAEWRAPLRWRLSGALFGGVATVAPEYRRMRLDELRPTGGGGLRWQVRPDHHLVIRGDLAFGLDSVRAFLTFRQAF